MVLLVILLALAAGAVAPAFAGDGPATVRAQAAEPTLEARAGFDGFGKLGRWLPVRVTVANDGPALGGDLRVVTRPPGGGAPLAYGQPVELPSRSRKLVQAAVPAPGTARDLRVELVDGEQVFATREVPIRLLSPTDFLVGALSDDAVPPAGLASLRRGGGPISVARLGLSDLPNEPAGLQALDALLVRNAATDRLTPEQRAALRAWVEAGGQLVVAGGPGWRRTVAGLGGLLPVEALQTVELEHLRTFGRYASGAAGAPSGGPLDGNVLVAAGAPVLGARVLLDQDDVPLVVERWLGQGRVTFVAADPALEPFRAWAGSESLWQRIVVGGRPLLPTPDGSAAAPLEPRLRETLARLMDLGLPGPGWLAACLLAYVLCVGPLQYAVLRRADRREWAWLGFPLLAVLFAGLVAWGGGRLRGPDVRLGAVSIVRSGPGSETAATDTYVGLVTPTRRSVDLQLVDGASLRPLEGAAGLANEIVTIEPGRPTRLPMLRVEGRTLQAFHARTYGPAPTPAHADLRATGGRLEGLVTNVGPDRLEDTVLLAAGEAVPLGDVAPGESRSVSLALPTTRAAASAPPSWPYGSARPYPAASADPSTAFGQTLFDERRAIVESLLTPSRGGEGESPGGAVLLGWVGATLPRVMTDGTPIQGKAARLVQQALPIRYGDEALVIPPGLLGRTLLDGAALSRGSQPAFVVRGPIVFQYDLPTDVSFARLDRLSVHLAYGTTGRGAGLPVRLALFRWTDRTWVDVPAGTTGVADVTFGAQFVDGGAIRVRVEPTGPEALVHQLDLSLEGSRT